MNLYGVRLLRQYSLYTNYKYACTVNILIFQIVDCNQLMLSMLGNISADYIWKHFYFSQKTDSDILYNLHPQETICMKCQPIFWEK